MIFMKVPVPTRSQPCDDRATRVGKWLPQAPLALVECASLNKAAPLLEFLAGECSRAQAFEDSAQGR